MSLFIDILKYADNLKMRLVGIVFFSSLSVIFGACNIVLIIPMLDILFDQESKGINPLPEFSLSSDYIIGVFNHYLQTVMHNHGKPEALFFVCTLIAICTLLANLFRFIEFITEIKIKLDVAKNIRLALFNNLSKLHIGFFHTRKKGDIVTRFVSDINEIESILIGALKSIIRDPITIVVYFIILFSISVKLTLFTILILPLTAGLLTQIIKKLKRQARQYQESLGQITHIAEETFGSMRIVKAFVAERFVYKKIQKELNRYRHVGLSMFYKQELASPLSEIIGVLIVTTIIFYGGNMVLASEPILQPNPFLGFLFLFARLIQPTKNLSGAITNIQKAKISCKRVFELINLKCAIHNDKNGIVLKELTEGIEFCNVSFAYEDNNLVLKNINLCIEKGKIIALVGPSGGGKSTIADLIARFYDPTEGDVKLNGIELQKYDIESVRRQIGIVSQESILFHDTLFNNIAFGFPHANEEQVVEAAKVANAHDFILQMKDGYQTVIGERGAKLSGGQKQRVSIARAVLKNPSILILDEATSALDAESEKLVQEALFSLMKNRTSLVIAHRLSTIQNAHKIIMVEKGEIIEQGTHNELIHRNSEYKKLIKIQNQAD